VEVEGVAEADDVAMMDAIASKANNYTTDGYEGPLESVENGVGSCV